jgi:hypothetical protein
MVSVGKYKILHCVSYLQMAGEDAQVDLEVFGGTAHFRVRFLVGEEDTDKQKLTFGSGPDPDSADRGLLTFTNWNRKEFRATSEPVHVAIVDEKNLYLIYAVSYDNSVYHVRLQFMEDTSETGGPGEHANV